MRRLLALLLALVLLTGCASVRETASYRAGAATLRTDSSYVADTETFSKAERACISFSDMKYIRPDGDTLLADLNVLYTRWFSVGGRGARSDILSQINGMLLDFMTMYSLCDLHAALDTSDAFYQNELVYLDELRQRISDLSRRFYERLLEPENESLRAELGSDAALADAERATRLASDDTAGLRSIEDALTRQYSVSASSATYTDAADLCERYYDDWSALFLRLCENRHKQAVALGYDNFAQLGFDRMGRQGYTAEDVARFRRAVKTYLTPVYHTLFEDAAARYSLGQPEFYLLTALAETPQVDLDSESLLETFRSVYAEMSEETGECVNYLLDYGLCDLLPASGKYPGGFQTYLYSYASPFIFGSFTGGDEDVGLFSHEFGHAFAAWVTVNPDPVRYQDNASSMDCREVQSSGMTLLTTRWYEEFFGEDADAFEAATVFELYGLILDCCMYDEWQEEVYTRWPEISALDDPAAELDSIAARLRREYYGELAYTYAEPYGEGKMWVSKSHLYETPFYMIDYALAYSVSLQLYSLSRGDWDRAFQVYMAMLHAAPESTFPEMVAAGGLGSPFDEDVIAQLGRTLNGLRQAG